MTSTTLVKRVGIAFFAVACAGSCGGRTDITPASVRLADFPTLGAQAFCGNAGHCCTDAGRQFDQATCLPKVEAALEMQFEPAPGSPATKDTTIPEKCLAIVASAATQCRSWSACAELLEATEQHAAEGEPCNGTCTRVLGTLSCAGTASGAPPCFTSDGLFCNTSGMCERRAANGQPCSDSEACASSRCDPNSMLCAPPLAAGSDCSSDVLGCDQGLVCETSSSIVCASLSNAVGLPCVCTSTLPDGAACSDGRQCTSSPCNDGLCQGVAINPSMLEICSG